MPTMRQGPGDASAERRGVKLDRVGMVLVHMLDDAGLGLDQGFRALQRQEKLARLEIEDAAEAADVMRALDVQRPEGEIRKVGIERRPRDAGREIAASPPAPASGSARP